MPENSGGGSAFAAVSGDDVHRPVPGGGDPGVPDAPEDRWEVLAPAAHHDLIDRFLLGCGVEVWIDFHGQTADGEVVRKIPVCAVCCKPVFHGEGEGAAQGPGISDDGGHVFLFQGIARELAGGVKAVGAVVGDKGVEGNARKAGHLHGRASGGDAEPDTGLLQVLQRLQSPFADAFCPGIDQGPVDIEEDDFDIHGKASFSIANDCSEPGFVLVAKV